MNQWHFYLIIFFMNTIKQLAKHYREVNFGGNWTSVNLKDTLADVTWEQATTKLNDLNTIAVLVFHINYYVRPIINGIDGKPLDARDKYSFDLPSITTETEWQELIEKALNDAENLAAKIEMIEEAKLFEDFSDPKYGSFYRNLLGVIEHTHYHLGQISLIKKLLSEN
jgi:hypothetical protein